MTPRAPVLRPLTPYLHSACSTLLCLLRHSYHLSISLLTLSILAFALLPFLLISFPFLVLPFLSIPFFAVSSFFPFFPPYFLSFLNISIFFFPSRFLLSAYLFFSISFPSLLFPCLSFPFRSFLSSFLSFLHAFLFFLCISISSLSSPFLSLSLFLLPFFFIYFPSLIFSCLSSPLRSFLYSSLLPLIIPPLVTFISFRHSLYISCCSGISFLALTSRLSHASYIYTCRSEPLLY